MRLKKSAVEIEGEPLGLTRFKRSLSKALQGKLDIGDEKLNHEVFEKRLNETIASAMRPPPKLSLSEWADEYAYLSVENASEPGKFYSMPYQRGIMDAISNSKAEQVVFMKSARVGATKIMDHMVGYYIHQDPSPIFMVQPTINDAKDYSVEEIAPMLRDTPVLKPLTISEKEKGSGVTQLRRKFTNGASVRFAGANSPAGFRRITVRVVGLDEIDGYPVQGAGNEGDPIALAMKRTETFHNRRIFMASTPTVKDASRIERYFELSDKRYYFVPCPHCDHEHVLKWKNLQWPEGEPAKAYFVCPNCGGIIEEKYKAGMIEKGRWKPTAESEIIGFHIWAGYSLFPNAAWGEIAKEHVEVKRSRDIQRRQVFTNTVLGEVWEDKGERVEAKGLLARREKYTKAPAGVCVVTAGVDIQNNRIEAEIVGWGAGNESWGLGKYVLPGDTLMDYVWQDLDNLLLLPVEHELGFKLPVAACCIDSGFAMTKVQAFCDMRGHRNVWAIRGLAGNAPLWPDKYSKRNKGNSVYFQIGTWEGKERIRQALLTEGYGDNYCHFNYNGYNDEHFDQLTAEEVRTVYKKGQPVREWHLKKGVYRNESLDCRNYALAGLEGLVKSGGLNLLREFDKISRGERPTYSINEILDDTTKPVRRKKKPRVVRSRV